jgi:CRP/FNR family transcriptional regulator
MEKNLSSGNTLRRFFESGTRLSYERGATIIHQEDDPQGVFLILEGFVKSFDITKYGEENLLVIRESGQIFPILWTMTDERTDVFYEAMSNVVLYRVDLKSYRKQIDENQAFIRDVLDQVLTMYKIHSQRVLNLEYRSAHERVVYCLLTLADRFGVKAQKGIRINAPIRHQDIASSVNCSRETASRELSKLEKKKLICSDEGTIVLCDLRSLASIVGQQSKHDKTFNLPT